MMGNTLKSANRHIPHVHTHTHTLYAHIFARLLADFVSINIFIAQREMTEEIKGFEVERKVPSCWVCAAYILTHTCKWGFNLIPLVPLFIFTPTPWLLALSHGVPQLKSTPVKWNSSSQAICVIGSLWFRRDAVHLRFNSLLSCCFWSLGGLSAPFSQMPLYVGEGT